MRSTFARWTLPARAAGVALAATVLLGLGFGFFLKPDPDVAKGNQLVKRGKPEEALKAYTRAEERLGRRVQLDYNRGLALFGMGKYDKARDAFLAAGGATQDALRRKSSYNLANTLYKEAEPTLAAAQKAAKEALDAEQKLAGLGAEVSVEARCQAMQQVTQVLKQAGEAQAAVEKAFGRPRGEYRRLLEATPSFFDAKWNLELCLRHQGAAKQAARQIEERGKALAERIQKECKQDQKDKQDPKQDQKDKQDPKQDPKQDQKQNAEPHDKKPLTKEDIAKERAGQELDNLERRQRERDQQRARSRTSQTPEKDW